MTLQQCILIKAAELIKDSSKWVKGSWYGSRAANEGKMCMLGAIGRAIEAEVGIPIWLQLSDPESAERCARRHNLVDQVIELIEPHVPHGRDKININGKRSRVVNFNDHTDTTHEEVCKVFCDAVKAKVVDKEDV